VSDADLRSSDSERWLSCFRWTVSRQPFSQRNRILIIRAPFVPFQSTRPPRGQFPQRPRFFSTQTIGAHTPACEIAYPQS
jgi:hypothetical protein